MIRSNIGLYMDLKADLGEKCGFAVGFRKFHIFGRNRHSDPNQCLGQYQTRKVTGNDQIIMHFVKYRPPVAKKL